MFFMQNPIDDNADRDDYVDRLAKCLMRHNEDQAYTNLENLLHEMRREGANVKEILDSSISRPLPATYVGYRDYTALHFLAREEQIALKARENKPSLLELVLKHGADPNSENYITNRPLHVAVFNQNEAAVRLLLKHEADPDLANTHARHGITGIVYSPTYAETPVHYAALYANRDILDLLVKQGGDLNIKTGEGYSALDLAEQRLAKAKKAKNAAETAIIVALLDYINPKPQAQLQLDDLLARQPAANHEQDARPNPVEAPVAAIAPPAREELREELAPRAQLEPNEQAPQAARPPVIWPRNQENRYGIAAQPGLLPARQPSNVPDLDELIRLQEEREQEHNRHNP